MNNTWNYDDELQLEPAEAKKLNLDPKTNYYAQANYDTEHFCDSGDGVYTPPTSWVNTSVEPGALFFRENPDTGDIDIPITEESEPELYNALFRSLDQKIYKYEAER